VAYTTGTIDNECEIHTCVTAWKHVILFTNLSRNIKNSSFEIHATKRKAWIQFMVKRNTTQKLTVALIFFLKYPIICIDNIVVMFQCLSAFWYYFPIFFFLK
jgi:hypothetical protein